MKDEKVREYIVSSWTRLSKMYEAGNTDGLLNEALNILKHIGTSVDGKIEIRNVHREVDPSTNITKLIFNIHLNIWRVLLVIDENGNIDEYEIISACCCTDY